MLSHMCYQLLIEASCLLPLFCSRHKSHPGPLSPLEGGKMLLLSLKISGFKTTQACWAPHVHLPGTAYGVLVSMIWPTRSLGPSNSLDSSVVAIHAPNLWNRFNPALHNQVRSFHSAPQVHPHLDTLKPRHFRRTIVRLRKRSGPQQITRAINRSRKN